MKRFSQLVLTSILTVYSMGAQSQCEADVTVYLTDFVFTPNAISISVGQTIAFVNAEGVHNVDGTAEGNPESFFIEQSEGNIDGVCMGTVTFDVPGTYSFTSSIGVQPDLGMNGSITVDAFTLADLMNEITYGDASLAYLESWESAYAMNAYLSPSFYEAQDPDSQPSYGVDLNGLEDYTVFVPTESATDALMELMNLSQFDMLGFYDMPNALKYHVIPGIYMAADLAAGMILETMEGQSVTIGMSDFGAMVDDANVIFTDFTAANGVVHIIDKVLAPAGYPGATTWDVIVQSPDHTILEQALLNEGLNEALRGQPILNDNEDAEGPFTVFAPTDDAFFALAEASGFESVEALLASQFMDDILYAHLVEAVYESDDLFNGQNLTSFGNDNVGISIDSEGIAANSAPIVQPNMLAYNGVVHSLGAVMPFDFPDPEGTCGAWQINMLAFGSSSEGWEGSTINVFADGTLLASETLTTGTTESFSVPVNNGSRIDVIYNNQGGFWSGNHGFEVEDQFGAVIYSSYASPPMSIYGLNPCEESPTCGLIEVTFTDGSQDGWYGGSMAVYSESGLEANIFFNPDFNGDGFADYDGFQSRPVMVTVDEGEIDFVVTPAVSFPNQTGYIVKNTSGEIVIDETSTNEAPPSTFNLEICESTTSHIGETAMDFNALSLFPNPVGTTAQIKGLAFNETWEAIVYGANGKVVHQQRGVGNEAVNVGTLAAGLYNLQLRVTGKSYEAIRFVKE
jgi:uncharacterized surface protein with fasciclin (FAS1) repeats/plastocyanin